MDRHRRCCWNFTEILTRNKSNNFFDPAKFTNFFKTHKKPPKMLYKRILDGYNKGELDKSSLIVFFFFFTMRF